jgi:hypothetical protein
MDDVLLDYFRNHCSGKGHAVQSLASESGCACWIGAGMTM